MKKNIIANVIGKFWSVFSSFIFVPLYIQILGFDNYSVISFSLLIAGIMLVLDSGLTATLSREFSRGDLKKNEKLTVYGTLESIFIIIIIISIAVLFFLSDYISNQWITGVGLTLNEISLCLKILSFEVGIQLLFRFYIGGFIGLDQQVKANIFQVIWGVARNGFVLIPIFFNPTLEVFFMWQLLITVFVTIAIKGFLNRSLGVKINYFKFGVSKHVLKKNGVFVGGMFLIALVAAINTQLDKIVISKLLSLENLGYYTLAVSIGQGLILLVSPITTSILPRLTKYFSLNQVLEASILVRNVSQIVAIVLSAFVANIIFFSNDLIWIWTGNYSIASEVSIYLPPISIAYCMVGIQLIPYYVSIANGYTKFNNILGLSSLFITIPGYYFAIQSFGAKGGAYLFCLVQIFSTVIFLYFVNSKFLKVGFIKCIIWRQLLLPFCIVLPISFMFKLIPNIFHEFRILSLFWIGIGTLIPILFTVYILKPLDFIKINISK